jgi:hypothetical protein
MYAAREVEGTWRVVREKLAKVKVKSGVRWQLKG